MGGGYVVEGVGCGCVSGSVVMPELRDNQPLPLSRTWGFLDDHSAKHTRLLRSLAWARVASEAAKLGGGATTMNGLRSVTGAPISSAAL